MPTWKQQTVKYGRGIWKDRRERSPPRDTAGIVRAGFAKFWVHNVLLKWISRPSRGQVIRQRCSRWCFWCPEKIEEQSRGREPSRQNLKEKRPRLPRERIGITHVARAICRAISGFISQIRYRGMTQIIPEILYQGTTYIVGCLWFIRKRGGQLDNAFHL